MAKHFLYLTNLFLTSYIVDRGRVVTKEQFSTLDSSTRDFERYLVKHRKYSVHLVLDLTEEDYRAETIPHLRGADQDAVLARRLGQIYRNSPFRHAIVQGREAEGRRDDKVLYHGIPNADLIKPWLAVIERIEVPLEGIYSAPVLSGQLLQSLDVFFPHTLLVSLSSGYGLRQTYFQNKHIKFSRLTQLQTTGEVDFGAQVAEECSRTWQYLDSLRFLSGDDQLEVCVLVPAQRQAELSRAIKDYPLLQFRLINDDEVAGVLKLKGWQGAEFADELLVSLFSQSRLQNHFAQSDQTRVARLQRLGVGLQALSAVILAGSGIGAAAMLMKGQQLSSEAERLQSQSADLARQYKQLMSQMQTAQVTADTSRDAASFASGFLEPSTSPQSMMASIAKVIARHPEIQVKHLGWKMGNEESTMPPAAPDALGTSLPVRTEVPANPAENRSPSTVGALVSNVTNQLQGLSTNVTLPGTDYQAVIIQATTGPFKGNYRELLDGMNRFVSELGQLPGCSASLIGVPLDVNTNASIRGTLAGGSTQIAEVAFKVKVVRISKLPEASRGK